MMKSFEEIQKANQQAMDATAKSFTEMNKGMQSLANEMSGYTKKSFEDGTAVMEQMMGVRSLEQALEIQSDYMRKYYNDAVAQAARVGEIYAEMSRDALKPAEKAMRKAK
ncbi:MAG: phasin family protein [Pseudomonadota bacterium]